MVDAGVSPTIISSHDVDIKERQAIILFFFYGELNGAVALIQFRKYLPRVDFALDYNECAINVAGIKLAVSNNS